MQKKREKIIETHVELGTNSSCNIKVMSKSYTCIVHSNILLYSAGIDGMHKLLQELYHAGKTNNVAVLGIFSAIEAQAKKYKDIKNIFGKNINSSDNSSNELESDMIDEQNTQFSKHHLN